MKATSYEIPQPVVIEKNWDGRLIARFAENVVEKTNEENGQNFTCYEYDEYIYEDDWSEKLARKIRDKREIYLAKAKENE